MMAPTALAGRRILVTGSDGFIAAAIVGRLRHLDCTIRRLHRPGSPGAPVEGLARIEDVAGDARDPEVWERALPGIDLVFHLAAQTSARVADDDPPLDFDRNVRPLLQLLEHCRHRGTRAGVVFASTTTIAGVPTQLPVDESQPDCPLTAYDVHKRMAELYLRWYALQGFVLGASLRLTTVYGPGPLSARADRGILNQMVRRALTGEPLTAYHPSDRLRDYVFVDDVAQAFLAAAGHLDHMAGDHFVIGSGVGTSLLEALELVAEQAARVTGRRVSVVEVDPPVSPSPIEARHFVADVRRFSALTSWRPSVKLSEGIERTVRAAAEALR